MQKKWLAALSTVMSLALVGGTIALSTANADDEVTYTKVAKYTFEDSTNLGKDTSGVGNNLTAIGSPTYVKEDNGDTAVKFDGESVLYAAGDDDGYDFADYLLEEEFTLSLSFYISSDIPDGVNFAARNAIFTIWGFQYNETNDYNSSSSAANQSTSALMFDSYADGASSVNLRYGVATAGDYNPYWEGTETSVATDTWHMATFSWDPLTRQTVISINDKTWTETAREDNNFLSKKARFTLGGYYNEAANNGELKHAGATTTINMVGMIKDVEVSTVYTAGNAYNKLISYDFASAETLGKANNSAYDLVEWKQNADGASVSYDASKDALYVPANTALVPKGFNEAEGVVWNTHDFMDYLAGESFTVSTSFMLPSNPATVADGRGVIFSLWGLWWGAQWNGDGADLVSSSVVYDSYPAGATAANIRIGFLYDNDDKTENGWWSNKERTVSTDVFHTLTVSVDNLNIIVYIDGEQLASYTASAKNAWGHLKTAFAIGGAAGYGGVTGSGDVYFKYFDVYDFAMSATEMGKLYKGNLQKVGAAYITSADLAADSLKVAFDSTDAEILAEAPATSTVTVNLSDETTATATAIWTGVEREGTNIYLVGEILGAGASNLLGVKAKMAVVEETISYTPATVEWTFGENNTITSSKGGVYELVSTKNTATTEDGVLNLNGDVIKAVKDTNGYDMMDYAYTGDFSFLVSFKLPAGVEQNHVFALTLFGENYAKAGTLILNNYGATNVTTSLRVGFAYDSENSSEGADGGFGSSYWTRYNTAVQIGVWNNIALTYTAETETLTVYLNGSEVCSYVVSGSKVWKDADENWGFQLGSPWNENQISYKALQYYDYAVSADNLKTLSKAGVMPEAAVTAVAEKAVDTVSSKATLTTTEALSVEKAVELMQQSGKTVRVTLKNEDLITTSVYWYSATANDDGTYTVTGELMGVYNPNGVKATATVSLETYKVSYTATNATVKVDGTAVTESKVAYGSSVSFTVEVASGYELVSVKAGETELTAKDGVYTLENVTAATTVTVETKEEVKQPTTSDSTSDSTTSETPNESTSDSTTSETPSTSDSTTNSGSTASGGCGSTVSALGVGFAALAIAAFFAKKKKDE